MASDNPKRKSCLLLENADGERSKWLGARTKTYSIPRGELLIECEASGKYQLQTDPNVQISRDYSVAKIWDHDFQLLMGIPNPEARYQVFYTNKTLSWGATLKVGDRARLTIYLPDAAEKWATAEVLIHYIGQYCNRPGIIFGVEISEQQYRGKGNSDGTVEGHPHFHCEANCGLFVSLDRLAPLSGVETGVDAVHKPLNQSLHEGSMIQLLLDGNKSEYGVVRWVGEVEGVPEIQAGVEMEDEVKGGTDGTYPGRKLKLFSCESGRALFCPLRSLQPDERFAEDSGSSMELVNPLDSVAHEEREDQMITTNQFQKYLGDSHGIQGHQNSCYLDATIFGLFALSHEFDKSLLGEVTDPTRKEISLLLRHGIVNTLRKNGVVRFESVMKLRDKLENLGKLTGINHDEKDPEEFLNMLFKFALQTEPFIRIRRPFGMEQEYFVQLFLENDESLKLPTVEDLLNKMFCEQNISFTEIPSKLLIIVPRYGRQFRTYKKIIPDLKLNISNLCDHECNLCGMTARKYCVNCSSDSEYGLKADLFCDGCWDRVHSHPHRKGHQFQFSNEVDDLKQLGELELISVICIETSHHVCFARSQQNKWLFFDSMADRLGDSFNVPKVVDCTQPLNDWVYGHDRHRLIDTPPRELPELVRRFTQDVYLCVYTKPVQKSLQAQTELSAALCKENVKLKEDKEREKEVREKLQKQLSIEKEENARRLEMAQKENTKLKQQLALKQQRDHEMQHKKVCTIDDWKVQRKDIVISESKMIEIGTWGEALLAKVNDKYVAVYAMDKMTYDCTLLQQEIEKVANLQHPSLVHFIGAVIDEVKPPCIVLERLDLNLRTAYKQNHFKSCRLPVLLDVAYGLHYLHTQIEPFVHGYVSAADVLLQPAGESHWRAKISAFRFSKFIEMPIENPVYLAPELRSDDGASQQPTIETDVYSYGILLCEVTAKEEPSPQSIDKASDKMQKAWPSMHDVFRHCTERDPSRRPSMAQILKPLHASDKVIVTSV